MSGLILLFILGVWGFASYSLARLIVGSIKNSNVRVAAHGVLMVLLFLAPVADDIIGGFQFRALCRDEAIFVIDIEKAKGATVVTLPNRDTELTDYILPIKKRYWEYKNVVTGETLISWNDFYAKGGWLSRTIGFPQGSPPYTFNGVCLSKDGFDYNFKKHNIKIVDKE